MHALWPETQDWPVIRRLLGDIGFVLAWTVVGVVTLGVICLVAYALGSLLGVIASLFANGWDKGWDIWR